MMRYICTCIYMHAHIDKRMRFKIKHKIVGNDFRYENDDVYTLVTNEYIHIYIYMYVYIFMYRMSRLFHQHDLPLLVLVVKTKKKQVLEIKGRHQKCL
jgi:hypothetical protein